MRFEESRLILDFDPTWSVLAFDKTPYFQDLAGQGLRGVDFLGVRENGLWLIEVKNYSPVHAHGKSWIPSPDELVDRVGQKFTDSQRIIRIIHRSFRRHLIYRAWSWLRDHHLAGRRSGPADWQFWTQVFDLLEDGQVFPCLLLLDPRCHFPRSGLPGAWTVIPDGTSGALLPGLTVLPATGHGTAENRIFEGPLRDRS